ncbi:Uncharacterized membrane protein [Parapedobacter luteus]|uniref:Uncharacterized membrane protein n=2 Tax=Parapedobacter luteus TaxID=623280 RepID=A0A1T5DCB6_9SPHI|nr:Uncharacterized membrane protein [Parapedobacter luteus]
MCCSNYLEAAMIDNTMTGYRFARMRSTWGGVLVGIGMMAAVDEIVFHQLLAWHHFYDGSTTDVGLMADGLLHATEIIAIAAGFIMLLKLKHSQLLIKRRAVAGFFLGAGGFQLFDGIVNHKILRLHQIRYVDPILPYDIAWNVAALILLFTGIYLIRRT